MVLRKVVYLFLLLCACNATNAQTSDALKVHQIKLNNGLTVWLNEDHSQPKVFGDIVVLAGAKDCPNTGIAHYFEHIMFKGTDKIGTTNYNEEKVWLDSIAQKYEVLASTKEESQRNAIQKDINRLSLKAAEYAIPNEFPQLINKYGGSGLNAGTSYDYTSFYNTFSPQYLNQWAELNSERLINPVFRLFQGELETVYEEKNMYVDNMIVPALEKVMSAYFGTNPYAYPIIGSTENLKNPRLSDMEAFFKKYYVASNMGLILSGDFQADSIRPLLEKTFGRIPEGVVPKREKATRPPLVGQQNVDIKVKIPIIKGELFAFNGPTNDAPDAPALDVALAVLSNNNKTGLLDSLSINHKMLEAAAIRTSFNDAGIVGYGYVPNIPFGSLDKAGKLCASQIEKLKKGDFSEKMLNELKQNMTKEAQSNLEDIDKRAGTMSVIMSEGCTWDDYLARVDAISKVTKADVVKAANKYFTTNYIKFKKKFGSYPKDKIAKPDYTPVESKNLNVSSDYAKELAKMPVQAVAPRFLDFKKDAQMIALTPHVNLYTAPNPMNDIFSLSISYPIGTLANPTLEAVQEYLGSLGTDSLSRQELGKALQALGTSIDTDVNEHNFSINLWGLDKNFDSSLKILAHLMNHITEDKEATKDVISSYKVGDKAFKESGDVVMDAMSEKVRYGNKSSFITHLSVAEAKKLTGEQLIKDFKELMTTECDISYTGQLPTAQVEQGVRAYLPINLSSKAGNDGYRAPLVTDKAMVYFYDMPSARQSIIRTYQTIPALSSLNDKAKFKIWGNYFGGGFSSVMFQEIRELRSYAYSASGSAVSAPLKHKEAPGYFITSLSTQTDKTLSAIQLLDSLFAQMPVRENNFANIKQEELNELSNYYPSFRGKANEIAAYRRWGYEVDPYMLDYNSQLPVTLQDMTDFYKSTILPSKRVIIIVGNKKQLPLAELAKFGTIIELKKSDIYR